MTILRPLKQSRIVMLSASEFKQCFEIALKKSHASRTYHKTGILAERGEIDTVFDFFPYILAERGVKKFFKDTFGVKIPLDAEIVQRPLSQQKFECIEEKGKLRKVQIRVSVEPNNRERRFHIPGHIDERENIGRKPDVHIFVGVGLSSDHLFRIVRDHSSFKIPVEIMGYYYHKELKEAVTRQKIKGRSFHRYVMSLAGIYNSDRDWKKLIKLL